MAVKVWKSQETNQPCRYLTDAFIKDTKNPVLIDRYLGGRELEVDAICDGTDVLIPGIMEHARTGVHSGDSISIYPPQNVPQHIIDKIVDVTYRIALELKVIGMINIQFIEFRDELYIIEVNPVQAVQYLISQGYKRTCY